MRRLFLALSIISLSAQLTLSAQDMVTATSDGGLEKTVSYSVELFTDRRDRQLLDVMKKMPGLDCDVDENNPFFTYNGMWVEKFYIDGQDILEGNNLPVYNMKPEDVERIEILENHVSVKVMRGISFSSSVAVNIVLKPKAAARWTGSLKVGAGASPFLYSGEFNTLYLGRGNTMSVVLKADDTGRNLGSGMDDFGGFSRYSLREFLRVDPSLAPLSDERVRFNHSTLTNVGSSVRLSDDYRLNLQAGFHTDRLTAGSEDETTYYLSDGTVVDRTGERALSRQRDLLFSATLLANTEKKYLSNTLKFQTRWRDVRKDITGSFPSDQAVLTTPLHIRDDFWLNLPVGGHLLSVMAQAAFLSRPQSLVLDREGEHFTQDIASMTGYLHAEAAYKVPLGRFTFETTAGLDGNIRALRSDMSAPGGMENERNDSRLRIGTASVKANVTYISRRLQASLQFPLDFVHYQLTDLLGSDDVSGPRFYFSPHADIKWEATDNLSVSASGMIWDDEVPRENMFSGLIFQDFRTAARGIPTLRTGHSARLGIDLAYKLPEHSLFVSGSAGLSSNKPAFLDVMDFAGDFIINGFEPVSEGYKNNNYNASFDISKGIKPLRGKVGLSIWMNRGSSVLTRNGTVIPFETQFLSVSPTLNGRILSWWNVIYGLDLSLNGMWIPGAEEKSRTVAYKQKLEMIFSPWERFNFSFLGEHYYTQFTEDQAKHLVLLDFKAEFRLNGRWTLMGSVINLLDSRSYNFTLVDPETLTRSFTSYDIRPRNLLLSVYMKF